jgi:hypothetical protein
VIEQLLQVDEFGGCVGGNRFGADLGAIRTSAQASRKL